MDSIRDIQEKIIEEFEELGDPFAQYSYLISLACTHSKMAEEEKTPERIVQGCQSRVWLDIRPRDGKFYFCSDSDTLIIKGVLLLLERLFCGQLCSDVAAAEVVFLRRTFIMDTFEADRQKGIGYVIKTLQYAAAGGNSI